MAAGVVSACRAAHLRVERVDDRASLYDAVGVGGMRGERPPARQARPGEVTVFDSTGTALEDVAAAVLVYERTLDVGAGFEPRLGA